MRMLSLYPYYGAFQIITLQTAVVETGTVLYSVMDRQMDTGTMYDEG